MIVSCLLDAGRVQGATMFDAAEYHRWLDTAHEDVRVARHNADGRFHHAAVLYAEQAAQCALKALLHAVGEGQRARGHGLLSLAEACHQWAGLPLDAGWREQLAELARNYQASRYPDALPEGTPRDHYGPASAERAIAMATRTIEAVTATWAALQEAAGDDRPAASDDAPARHGRGGGQG